jgi:regulator of sigma E protease
MQTFLISVVATVFVLGVMIVVHEFGHFAAAKLLGVRVEQFAIGFGQRIIGFRRGETDYRINWIPLGGYVKMSGENPMDTHTGDPREFMSHPRWHRLIIAFAGPTMNLVLAVALLTGVYMVHYQHPAYQNQHPTIGIVENGSPAQAAGLQPGDRIIRVGNQQNPTWQDVEMQIGLSPGHPVNLGIQRGSGILSVSVTPRAEGRDSIGSVGLFPSLPVSIGALEPGMPAAKAGLREGDIIRAINGAPVKNIEQFIDDLQKLEGNPVQLTIERNGQEFTQTVAAVKSDSRWRMGFRAGVPMITETLPFPQAFSKSLDANKKMSGWMLQTLEKLIQRQVSIRQMSGPIGIGAMAGQAAQEPGWSPLMELMALISLNLGIVNLLPIPILDGGVILLLVIEELMRRDISMAVKERIYQAAFVFLILFFVMIIYNDIMKYIPQRMP